MRTADIKFLRWLACLVGAIVITGAGRVEAETPSRPEMQAALKPMLKIVWHRGPDLPQGFQDSDGGFLGNRLFTVCGFCDGSDEKHKPGKHPRGFLKKAWSWDITHPEQAWEAAPDFPGAARQAVSAAVVDQSLYVLGGFSYDAPYAYTDGYRLQRPVLSAAKSTCSAARTMIPTSFTPTRTGTDTMRGWARGFWFWTQKI